MAGSIRKRGENSWEIQITLGKDPVTGKKKRIYETVHGTRKDAQKALRNLLHSIDEGTFVEPSKMTVRQFLEQWLTTHKPNVAPTTWTWYQLVCQKHIIPHLGDIPLQKLTPLAIQEFYIQKLETGRLDGKGKTLSSNSVKHIHRILHKALETAVKLQIINRNPCDSVEPPKVVKKEARYWTPEEAAKFLEAIKDDRLYALFYLALGTGLRRGELLGLRWEDIDLAKGCLTVRQELVRAQRGTLFKEPKTESSKATIALSRSVIDVLKQHKVRQAKERLMMGDQYHDNGLVFTKFDGSPLEPTCISGRYFRKLIKKAGVRQINFHGLRHTHGTVLGAAGVPLKSVSKRLRHSSVAITGDIYSHVFDEMDREVAETFDDILQKARARI
ncbi:MAG TPA: site-specific integrase [Firmicutes bacterium]|nr:site-specific integrase [Bacillota bacterium]